MRSVVAENQKSAGKVELIFLRLSRLLPAGYWPWVLLMVSVGLIAWQTTLFSETASYVQGFLAGSFGDSIEGWNKSVRESPATHHQALTLYSFGSILLGIIVLFVTFGLVVLAVWLHYRLLYKPLFLRAGLSYTFLYVIWLMAFWRMIVFVGHDFKPGMSAESIAYATFLTALCIVWAFLQNLRQNRRQQLILVQQRTQAELDALRAQVNPHFLFNSLNNIYGTAILENSPRTAESIQQLSGIVRYVMEESRLKTTDIRRELRFIDDFVELQRIRLPKQNTIDISVTIDWDEKPAQIVPLLLNPLIENAFKYGISIHHPCFVRIRLRVQDGTLHLITENSLLRRTELEKGTGLGLANVRQRLTLAYPNRHVLIVNEETDTFLVDLTIRL